MEDDRILAERVQAQINDNRPLIAKKSQHDKDQDKKKKRPSKSLKQSPDQAIATAPSNSSHISMQSPEANSHS